MSFHWEPKTQQVPDHAETHNRSTFESISREPSRYIQGADVSIHDFLCPNCSHSGTIGPAQRVRCDCGLIMECHGNALDIWTEDGKPCPTGIKSVASRSLEGRA